MASFRRPIFRHTTAAVVLYFCTCAVCRAQTHDIDSLRNVIASTREDITKASTLYKLSREYWDRDLDTAFMIAQQLLELSERIGHGTGLGHAYSSMGVVRWYQGNYPEAQHYNELALKAHLSVDPQRNTDIAGSYHNLGLVHDDEGNYPEALRYYLEAMKLYEVAGMEDGVAQEHSAIAVIHFNQHDLAASLAGHRKALAIREATNDEWGLTETYSNIGIAYAEMGHYDSALVWYDKALALREHIDDRQGLAVSHNNYGDLHTMQGRYAEALASFRRALAINERLGYKKSMADVHLNMGKLFDRRGDPRTALHHKELALVLAEEVGATDIAHRALGELSTTAAELGDHRSAYAYRLRFEALTDTIFNTEKTRSLVRQQMNYTFAKKQLADSLAAVEATHVAERDHQLQLASERNRRNLIAMGGASLLLLSIGLWSRLRYTRRTRDIILRTQQRLVASEKQREAEQVRTRIARDVHDEIGSEVTKITLLIAETKREQRRSPMGAPDHLDDIAALSRQVGSALNDIVWAVDPRHDSVEALVEHARHFAERMLVNSTVRSDRHFEHSGPDRPLDPATKRNIFLLLKEALNNALKYAKAGHVLVSLETSASAFRLLVKDDGVGFDPAARAEEGNGLRNMRARAEALGADLRITSTPGAGCTVEAGGPLA